MKLSRMNLLVMAFGLTLVGGYLTNQLGAEQEKPKSDFSDFGISETFAFNDDEAELGKEASGELKLDFQPNQLKKSLTPSERLRRLKIEVELKAVEEELSDKMAEFNRMETLVEKGYIPSSDKNKAKREINKLKGELDILQFRLTHPEAEIEEIEAEDEETGDHGIDMGDLPYEILERVLDRTEGIREEARRSLLQNLKEVIQQLEVDDEIEIDDDILEFEIDLEHHPGNASSHRQIERLIEAAELLKAAGEHEQAEKLFQKAERLEQEHRHHQGNKELHHEGRLFDEIFKELKGLREELHDVHHEVQEIRKLIEQEKKESVQLKTKKDSEFVINN